MSLHAVGSLERPLRIRLNEFSFVVRKSNKESPAEFHRFVDRTTSKPVGSILYNRAMNKRARKRLKEAIEKKNLERQKMLKEQSSASSQTKERRGFTVKPEKKRG